jgi:signal transduction histidine kinase
VFLFAFSFFYVGACLRVLKNLGIVESNFTTEYSYQFGTLIHMLVMTAAVFWGYVKTQREKSIAELKLQSERELRKDQNNFIAMISHELRNPLSIISASTENLMTEKALSPEIRNRISKISRANQRLSQLVMEYLHNEEILDAAATLHFESSDLNLIVKDALQYFNDLVPAPIFHPNPGIAKAMIDVRMIKMVIFNLVTNAVRYSPNCAPVVTCQTLESWFEIVVFNEGSGIPEEDIPHIFKKFYRGANATGTSGSGLGLYLIEAIVSKHHGNMTARNIASRGCEFIVRLPLVVNASGANIQL